MCPSIYIFFDFLFSRNFVMRLTRIFLKLTIRMRDVVEM